MLQKKKICFKYIFNQFFFPQQKKDLIFYPKTIIEFSEINIIKIYGKLFLHQNKFSTNFLLENFKFVHSFFNLNAFKIFPSLINKVINLNTIENTSENKEEIREFLMSINDNSILKNSNDKKIKKPSILIVFPNQTFLVQLIKTLFRIIKKRNEMVSFKKIFKNIQLKTPKKLKYGGFIMPADHRNCFQDGKLDDLNIYAILIDKVIKFSKKFITSDIVFTTPTALKKGWVGFKTIFSNIRLCWVDSLETILMQNTENLIFVIKNLLEIRMNLIYKQIDFLKSGGEKKLLFKIFLISTVVPNFLLRLFFTLSISNFYFLKNSKNLKTYGALVYSKNYFYKKNTITAKNKDFNRPKILKLKIEKILKIKKQFGLVIFARTYSDLIPIRNVLLKIKKIKRLKIIVFNEYTKDYHKNFQKTSSLKGENFINLVTERYFFFFRTLFIKFDLIYFKTYPINKEFYYEIIGQANIKQDIKD